MPENLDNLTELLERKRDHRPKDRRSVLIQKATISRLLEVLAETRRLREEAHHGDTESTEEA